MITITATVGAAPFVLTIHAYATLRSEGIVVRYDADIGGYGSGGYGSRGINASVIAEAIVERTDMSYTHARGILDGLETAALAVHAATTNQKVAW